MTSNNLCNSCSNYGCEFQSGIVRTKCAFYMPPHIESDNCGNYVVMQPTVNVLDEIRAEIEQNAYPIVHGVNSHEKGMTLYGILQIIDKYKVESEG